jgi:glycosyltransferase involved in cell wall biosynthesis
VKLVAICMVKDEEYWIWYALQSVAPFVERILLFDNHSQDETLGIVRNMRSLSDKLEIHEHFGGESENENRERCLEAARAEGATHVLFLDGDEVHNERDLALARRLLEVVQHEPPLREPPDNQRAPLDHTPAEGVLIKHVGFKPVHAGFEGPRTCIPQDRAQPDSDHGCYNFAIRICTLAGLRGNGKEWGQHGYLENEGTYIQSSPYTLWAPGLFYHHFTHHPRSSRRDPSSGQWIRPVRDLGSVPVRAAVELPNVLFRSDGPVNPTLKAWGLRT